MTVDDCEQVTRQLQHALEVDGVDYARAWRSRRPGLTGRCASAADWHRFAGSEVEV